MSKSQLKCQHDMCCWEVQVWSREVDKKCQGRDMVHFWQSLWNRTDGTVLYQTSNACQLLSVMGSNLGLIVLKSPKVGPFPGPPPLWGGSKEGRKQRLQTGRDYESSRRANVCAWWVYTSCESQGMALLPPQLLNSLFQAMIQHHPRLGASQRSIYWWVVTGVVQTQLPRWCTDHTEIQGMMVPYL